MATCVAAAVMFKRRFLLIASAVALLAVLAAWGWYRSYAAEMLEQNFGGVDVLAVVRQPDKVEAFRLENSTPRPSLNDYQIVGDPIPVDSATANRFSRILTSGTSYQWFAVKSCMPVYGVRLRFTKGVSSVDVIFCFDCDILEVFLEGNPVGGGNFEFVQGKLARLMRAVFPNDDGIQSIK